MEDIIGSEYLSNVDSMITHEIMSIYKQKTDRAFYHHEYLTNGIEVLFVTDANAKSRITMSVDVGYNSDYIEVDGEIREIQGLAHLLEHVLMVNESAQGTHGKILDDIYKNEGYYNGYTQFNKTFYMMEFNNGFFSNGESKSRRKIPEIPYNIIKMFSDNFVIDDLNYDSMIKEINSVDNEHSNLKSNYTMQIRSLLNSVHTKHHRFGNGDKESLLKYGPDILLKALTKFYRTHYVGNNIRMIVVNNVVNHKLIDTIRKLFGRIRDEPIEQDILSIPNSIFDYDYFNKKYGGKTYVIKALPSNSAKRNALAIDYLIYEDVTDDYYNVFSAINLLSDILNGIMDGSDSRIRRDLYKYGSTTASYTPLIMNSVRNENQGYIMNLMVMCDLAFQHNHLMIIKMINQYLMNIYNSFDEIFDGHYEAFVKTTIIDNVFKQDYNEKFNTEFDRMSFFEIISNRRIDFTEIRISPLIANKEKVKVHLRRMLGKIVHGTCIALCLSNNNKDILNDNSNEIKTDPYYDNLYVIEEYQFDPSIYSIYRKDVFGSIYNYSTLISFEDLQTKIDALENNQHIDNSYYSSINSINSMGSVNSINSMLGNNVYSLGDIDIQRDIKVIQIDKTQLHMHAEYIDKSRASYSRGNIMISIKFPCVTCVDDLLVHILLKIGMNNIGKYILELNNTSNKTSIRYDYNYSQIIIELNSIHITQDILKMLIKMFNGFIEAYAHIDINLFRLMFNSIINDTINFNTISVMNVMHNNTYKSSIDYIYNSTFQNIMNRLSYLVSNISSKLLTLNIPYNISVEISNNINSILTAHPMIDINSQSRGKTHKISNKINNNVNDDIPINYIGGDECTNIKMSYTMYVCSTRYGYTNNDCIADQIPIKIITKYLTKALIDKFRYELGLSYMSCVRLYSTFDKSGDGMTDWYLDIYSDSSSPDIIDSIKDYVKNELFDIVDKLDKSDIDYLCENYTTSISSYMDSQSLFMMKYMTLVSMNNFDDKYYLTDTYKIKRVMDSRYTSKDIILEMMRKTIYENQHYITVFRS